MTIYLDKYMIMDNNFINILAFVMQTIIKTDSNIISAYFHEINDRKSEEGFNMTTLVLRQVDAVCGLCTQSTPN